MVKHTGVVLGTLVALALPAAGWAADLPSRGAAPVEYVRDCTLGSFSGVLIPSTDTCLKIGGFVRYQASYAEPKWTTAVGNGRSQDGVTQVATASVQVDARTSTEYGLLRSYADVRVASSGAAIATIDKAYIQFAGLHAGKVQSLFDFYADDASYGNLSIGSDHSTVALGYTASFGQGLYGVVSLEDPTSTRRPIATYTPYGGKRIPDVVAAIGIEQDWGKAQLSAALHSLNTPNIGIPYIGDGKTHWGYAIQGGAKINLPRIGVNDALWLQAAYADGAVTYLGVPGTAIGHLGVTFPPLASDYDYAYDSTGTIPVPGNLRKTTGYNLTIAYEHGWSPSLFSNVFAGYTVYDPKRSAGNLAYDAIGVSFPARKAEVLQVGANVTWKPVKGFLLAAEVAYFGTRLNAPITVAGGGVTKSDQVVQSLVRLQRDF